LFVLLGTVYCLCLLTGDSEYIARSMRQTTTTTTMTDDD